MKYLIDFLSDRKVLLGIGIGIIISTVIMSSVKFNNNISSTEIEKRAKALGMDYPSEFKVINKDVSK
ncbi:hypothetical protein JK636_19880 [Clostridium sp. YIM B02515]|uniref:Uncharacterized protein n=1 Tax=Clostridium rhizosphaerae TaxID=2803861 RepID=A0ABS1TF25_9CLOT|nr:hypothetical protein [Clostridium rhizosphaerae]